MMMKRKKKKYFVFLFKIQVQVTASKQIAIQIHTHSKEYERISWSNKIVDAIFMCLLNHEYIRLSKQNLLSKMKQAMR